MGRLARLQGCTECQGSTQQLQTPTTVMQHRLSRLPLRHLPLVHCPPRCTRLRLLEAEEAVGAEVLLGLRVCGWTGHDVPAQRLHAAQGGRGGGREGADEAPRGEAAAREGGRQESGGHCPPPPSPAHPACTCCLAAPPKPPPHTAHSALLPSAAAAWPASACRRSRRSACSWNRLFLEGRPML